MLLMDLAAAVAAPVFRPHWELHRMGDLRVTGGLSINSASFDVEFFSQTVPTQIMFKGEKASVSLKIFDNEGPTTVTHVELHIAPYEEFVSSTFVEKSLATLVWDGKAGDEVIGVYDDESFLQNVSIEAIVEDNFKIIVFEFTPVADLEKSSLLTILWDDDRNVVKNYFIDSIQVVDPAHPIASSVAGDANVVPEWIKTSAGWWAEEKIDDSDFLGGIEFMIQTEVLSFDTINISDANPDDAEIPQWIKKTAKWWSADLIPEDDFVRGIQFLINNGMITL